MIPSTTVLFRKASCIGYMHNYKTLGKHDEKHENAW